MGSMQILVSLVKPNVWGYILFSVMASRLFLLFLSAPAHSHISRILSIFVSSSFHVGDNLSFAMNVIGLFEALMGKYRHICRSGVRPFSRERFHAHIPIINDDCKNGVFVFCRLTLGLVRIKTSELHVMLLNKYEIL